MQPYSSLASSDDSAGPFARLTRKRSLVQPSFTCKASLLIGGEDTERHTLTDYKGAT